MFTERGISFLFESTFLVLSIMKRDYWHVHQWSFVLEKYFMNILKSMISINIFSSSKAKKIGQCW